MPKTFCKILYHYKELKAYVFWWDRWKKYMETFILILRWHLILNLLSYIYLIWFLVNKFMNVSHGQNISLWCDIWYVKIRWYRVSIIFPYILFPLSLYWISKACHLSYLNIYFIYVQIFRNGEKAGMCVFRTTVRMRDKCPLDSR